MKLRALNIPEILLRFISSFALIENASIEVFFKNVKLMCSPVAAMAQEHPDERVFSEKNHAAKDSDMYILLNNARVDFSTNLNANALNLCRVRFLVQRSLLKSSKQFGTR